MGTCSGIWVIQRLLYASIAASCSSSWPFTGSIWASMNSELASARCSRSSRVVARRSPARSDVTLTTRCGSPSS